MCNVFNKLLGPGDLISLALGAIVGAAFVALAIAAVTIMPLVEALAEGLDFLRPWTDTNLLQ